MFSQLLQHLFQFLQAFHAARSDRVVGEPFLSLPNEPQGGVIAFARFGCVFLPVLRTTERDFREAKACLHFDAYEIVHVPFEIMQVVLEDRVFAHNYFNP
jgi:hypothetical protein